jgi:hypothetical protein
LSFDLTNMRLFLTVVEQGSLTKGAESMNLALCLGNYLSIGKLQAGVRTSWKTCLSTARGRRELRRRREVKVFR